MTRFGPRVAASLVLLALAACAMRGPERAAADVRAEIAPTGTLRLGVNFGNAAVAQRDASGGEPRGVGPALGRELARRLGVPVTYVVYDNAARMAEAAKAGAWDVGFLAIDPARAADIDFSAPYALVEETYLVRKEAPFARVADVDREGVRIAVGQGTAYDLFLARTLKRATLVRAPTSAAAIERFRVERLDAVAGVRHPLAAAAAADPGLRLLDDNFLVIGQAAGVPKGRPRASTYLGRFIEEAKASGFVARALRESGVHEATVAPGITPAGSP